MEVMNIRRIFGTDVLKSRRKTFLLMAMLFASGMASAQVLVKGNVYGGGELGCVGTYAFTTDMRNFYWTNELLEANKTTYTYNSTGVSNVTVNGSSAVIKGNVFGAGKGKDDSFWCEKGIVYSSNVSISAGTVEKNVYGGGEVGRVETNTLVKIGPDTGTGAPTINGSVFGAGAGVETHGYSTLVRGNTTVTVQSGAKVKQNVYGGGEIAAVGKYSLVSRPRQGPDRFPGTDLRLATEESPFPHRPLCEG